MTIIFKAKTNEGYTLKVLSELLQNNVRIACLEISSKGISMRMMDSHRYILIDIVLENIYFNIYDLAVDNMYIGVNLVHLYKMIKSVKKKDSVMLTIDDAKPDDLTVTIYPKENNRIIRTDIRIQTIQHISIPLPLNYQNPIIIPSSDYQRTLKDMNNIAKNLTISMKRHSLKISCSADIYSKEALFGELVDDSDEYYQDTFDIDKFIRILKISGLSNHMQIYSGDKSRPLLVVSNVGQLGKISLYIKSQSQIHDDGMKE